MNGIRIARMLTAEYGEMMTSVRGIKSQVTNNYKVGARLAEIKGYQKLPTVTNSIFSRTKITKKQLPAAMALLGTVSPIPGGTVLGYTFGKIIKKFL